MNSVKRSRPKKNSLLKFSESASKPQNPYTLQPDMIAPKMIFYTEADGVKYERGKKHTPREMESD